MRLSVRLEVCVTVIPWSFMGRMQRTAHPKQDALPVTVPYLWISQFQGATAVKQHRQRYAGPHSAYPSSIVLPQYTHDLAQEY